MKKDIENIQCECKSVKKLWLCEECFLRRECIDCGHPYKYTGLDGVFWRECLCV